MIITLKRFLYWSTATIGELRAPSFSCFTIERPWLDNAQNVSCIPAGAYQIKRGTFKKKYENFEVLAVPNRTAIEMHIANFAHELHGCIALGDSFIADSAGQNFMVKNSKNTFAAFMAAMSGVSDAVLLICENTTSTWKV